MKNTERAAAAIPFMRTSLYQSNARQDATIGKQQCKATSNNIINIWHATAVLVGTVFSKKHAV